MSKEDLILHALKVLLMDNPKELVETRKCLRHSIDEALNPQLKELTPCDMSDLNRMDAEDDDALQEKAE